MKLTFFVFLTLVSLSFAVAESPYDVVTSPAHSYHPANIFHSRSSGSSGGTPAEPTALRPQHALGGVLAILTGTEQGDYELMRKPSDVLKLLRAVSSAREPLPMSRVRGAFTVNGWRSKKLTLSGALNDSLRTARSDFYDDVVSSDTGLEQILTRNLSEGGTRALVLENLANVQLNFPMPMLQRLPPKCGNRLLKIFQAAELYLELDRQRYRRAATSYFGHEIDAIRDARNKVVSTFVGAVRKLPELATPAHIS